MHGRRRWWQRGWHGVLFIPLLMDRCKLNISNLVWSTLLCRLSFQEILAPSLIPSDIRLTCSATAEVGFFWATEVFCWGFPRTHYLVTLNSFLGVTLSDPISLNSQWGRELMVKLMIIPSSSVTGVKINSNVHHHSHSKNLIDKKTTSTIILTNIMFILLTITIINSIGKRPGWIDKRIMNVFFYSRLAWIGWKERAVLGQPSAPFPLFTPIHTCSAGASFGRVLQKITKTKKNFRKGPVLLSPYCCIVLRVT